MRIAKNILDGVAGVEWFPIIAMLIFLIFFIGMVIWVIRLKSDDVKANSHLPFDDEEDESTGDLEKNHQD